MKYIDETKEAWTEFVENSWNREIPHWERSGLLDGLSGMPKAKMATLLTIQQRWMGEGSIPKEMGPWVLPLVRRIFAEFCSDVSFGVASLPVNIQYIDDKKLIAQASIHRLQFDTPMKLLSGGYGSFDVEVENCEILGNAIKNKLETIANEYKVWTMYIPLVEFIFSPTFDVTVPFHVQTVEVIGFVTRYFYFPIDYQPNP